MNSVDKVDKKYGVIVIGGGPGGLAAAVEASKTCDKVLLLERSPQLGGILNQCIHNGFGLHMFKEELTGPDYAEKYIEKLQDTRVVVLTQAMVLETTKQKQVSFIHPKLGFVKVQAEALIVATGCRERTRGAIGISGARPSGVFTAGAAQLFLNLDAKTVGKKVVILGSGDIGLIMARRMTLEGAKVLGVYEVMPYSGGLTRNIVQCLNDYDIPLHLSHTITKIHGEKRVEAVTISKVDENRQPIAGTEHTVECDTVLLSVGLIPENELNIEMGVDMNGRTNTPVLFDNMETSVPGVFACGNVAQVHDLVDFVSMEGIKAGAAAADYANGIKPSYTKTVRVEAGEHLLYVTPSQVRLGDDKKIVELFFRVSGIFGASSIQVVSGDTVIKEFKKEHLAPGELEKIVLTKQQIAECSSIRIGVASQNKHSEYQVPVQTVDPDGSKHFVCTICPKGCSLTAKVQNEQVEITGNACPRGDVYGKQEAVFPMRVVTSTVKTEGFAHTFCVPVKTTAPIPKDKVAKAMQLINAVVVKNPAPRGAVVLRDILGLGVDVVLTKTLSQPI